MRRILALGLMLALAAPASAQLYKWVDKDGRTRYTDQPPPPGVASKTIGAPPQAAAPAADAAASSAPKDAPAAPLTPVQQEQAFRKRQLEATQAEEKAEAAQKDAAVKQANCDRARSALATYDSGQRVTRTGADGERYYIDDETRAKEARAAAQAVKDWCQ